MNVWCTEMVYQDLTTGFPVFNMLKHWNGGLLNIIKLILNKLLKLMVSENLEFLPLIIQRHPYIPTSP